VPHTDDERGSLNEVGGHCPRARRTGFEVIVRRDRLGEARRVTGRFVTL
jgi:hypothetical protein